MAQTSLGIYAGPNFSNISVESGIEHEGAVVPTVGLLAEIALAKNLTLSIQPAWLVEGVVAKSAWGYDEAALQSHYVTIPLMVAYQFNAGSIKPYVTAGVSLDILLRAETEQNSKWYVFDDLASRDLTVNVGAGVLYTIGSNALFLEVRYMHGVQNLYKEDSNAYWSLQRASFEPMSRSVAVLVGYKFML
jgi:outer membrane protein W